MHSAAWSGQALPIAFPSSPTAHLPLTNKDTGFKELPPWSGTSDLTKRPFKDCGRQMWWDPNFSCLSLFQEFSWLNSKTESPFCLSSNTGKLKILLCLCPSSNIQLVLLKTAPATSLGWHQQQLSSLFLVRTNLPITGNRPTAPGHQPRETSLALSHEQRPPDKGGYSSCDSLGVYSDAQIMENPENWTLLLCHAILWCWSLRQLVCCSSVPSGILTNPCKTAAQTKMVMRMLVTTTMGRQRERCDGQWVSPTNLITAARKVWLLFLCRASLKNSGDPGRG